MDKYKLIIVVGLPCSGETIDTKSSNGYQST